MQVSTTLNKNNLSKAVGIAYKAISSNPVIPLLGNMLFESNNGNTRVAGTNLELGISYELPSKSKKSFKTCIPAKTLAGLMDAIHAEEVELRYDSATQALVVMTEQSTSTIRCAPADEFPQIPKVVEPTITMSIALFKKMVQRVAFAARLNDNNSNLNGVLLTVTGKKLIMFATDGFHLSYEETKEYKGSAFDTVIPGTTLETISRILSDNIEEDAEVEIEVSENKVLFHCGSVDVVAQTLSGKFPDYKLLKAPASTTTVTISTIELLRACKQLKVFASEVGTSKLDVSGMLVRYSALAQDKGDGDILLPAKKVGNDIVIGVNVHFLQEFLEISETEMVTIEFSGTQAPILLKMVDFDTYYHIIMPITI